MKKRIMKKQKALIILALIGLMIISLKSYADELPNEAINCGYITDYIYYNGQHYHAKWYTDYDSARAARDSEHPECNVANPVYKYLCMEPEYWEADARICYSGAPEYIYNTYFYAYPVAGKTCPGGGPLYSPPLNDQDGDGLPDVCDPYPTDPDPAIIKKVSSQGETGNETWINFELKKGGYISYGTYDENETEYLQIGSSWTDQSWLVENGWCDEYEGGENEEGESPFEGIEIEIPPNENPEDLEDGINNEGNVTEIDHLADIVNNTRAITDNMQTISDQLHDLHVDNVKSQIEDQQDEQEANEELAEQIVDLENLNTELDGAFTELDKPEENLIRDLIDGFVADNPVQDIIDNTGIDTTGSFCSFDWQYKGNDITFSICEYQTQLQLMGTILLAITALCSLVIVLRR